MRLFPVFIGFLMSAAIFGLFLFLKQQNSSKTDLLVQVAETIITPEYENPSALQPYYETEINLQPELDKINLLIKENNGDYSYYIKNISNGKVYKYNESKVFNAASLYKFPVAVAVLKNIENKSITFSTLYEYKPEDFEGGAGSVHLNSYGTKFDVQTLFNLILIESDNAALNILTRSLNSNELKNTFSVTSIPDTFYRNNEVTAEQIGEYFAYIATSNYLTDNSKEILWRTMIKTNFDNRINLGLAENITFAHKIGTQPSFNSWHDCGVIFKESQAKYMICLMSSNTNWSDFQTVARSIGELF